MFAPTLLKGNGGSSDDFVGLFAAVTVYMWANIQQEWSLYTDHLELICNNNWLTGHCPAYTQLLTKDI